MAHSTIQAAEIIIEKMNEDYPKNTGPCVVDDCTNFSGHSTGFCETCRTVYCPMCKRNYVMSKIPSNAVTICGKCRHKYSSTLKKLKKG